jgi:AcrR family transcriptional regulator
MNVRQKVRALEKTPQAKALRGRTDASTKPNARDRILNAVLSVAKQSGVGHLSLNAIARQAGVSKGGLLYHFPTKTALMRALVEHHLAAIDHAIAETEARLPSPNAVATALVDVHREAFECRGRLTPGQVLQAPGSALAAFVEDPSLFDPIRLHHRRVVENIRKSAADPDLSLIAFLALEGMKTHDVLELDCLTGDERRRVLDALGALLLPKA